LSNSRAAAPLAAALLILSSACGGSSAGDASAASSERVAAGGGAVLVGAGDIAGCKGNGAVRTGRLLDAIPGTVIMLGDAAYGSKRVANAFSCYDVAWGRHKGRTRAVPGNHEYDDTGIDNYFQYFGAAAGPGREGYYSFDAGDWHVVALNSNVDMRRGSPQDVWLRADLAAHRGKCAIALMHHPRWSSGPHQSDRRSVPAWETLEQLGVSAVVAGHDHVYERFRRQRADGTPDTTRGMRQFVVGTGGVNHYDLARVDTGSEVRNDSTYGVLKLTLLPASYRWEFVPVAGKSFRDAGESSCRKVTAP
jgi:hypothetical protein